MKNLKKIMAAVLATGMITAMAAGAISSYAAGHSGVTITINRDSTFAGDETSTSRQFTWYKVFSVASYGAGSGSYEGATGGGYDASGAGVALTQNNDANVTYEATAAVAVKLGSWGTEATDNAATTDIDESKDNHWIKSNGNLWFDLAPIAGSNPAKYSVKWINTNTDAATVQAAAEWLLKNEVYEANSNGEAALANGTWSATVTPGYYIIESVAGKNLIAATSDITINEKNAYPPIDKTQADDEDTTQSDTTRSVEVGDVLTYEVKVTIPKTAAVGDKIIVWDKPSNGLTYQNDVALKSGTNTGNAKIEDYSGSEVPSGVSWAKKITVTNVNQAGTDVVFTFTMKVNSSAIVDDEKKNESTLKYGRGSGTELYPYTSQPDKVEYETYFGGIHKIDGATEEDLEGVKFTLKDASGTYLVTKHADGYYYPDPNGSGTVITDGSGTIKIRGLDNDKAGQYTLTEIETLPGYNMITDPIVLDLVLDSKTEVKYIKANSFDENETYYNASGSVVTVTSGTFANGTYYTKSVTTTSGSYEMYTSWQEVENNKGSLLPSTGGIGTTIFYVVGAVLVIGSGIVLVTKKRMGKEEN